ICRKLSIIHSVKCNKASSFEIALSSNAKLMGFFQSITSLSQENFEAFNREVQIWMDSPPIASEQDINDIFKK
ncbi:MAG TPA: hypothetical protein PLR98_11985, partial [Chitinophagaceae bacterium]|nr:hypothetical protein [Chitinophagaceae bacterium]